MRCSWNGKRETCEAPLKIKILAHWRRFYEGRKFCTKFESQNDFFCALRIIFKALIPNRNFEIGAFQFFSIHEIIF